MSIELQRSRISIKATYYNNTHLVGFVRNRNPFRATKSGALPESTLAVSNRVLRPQSRQYDRPSNHLVFAAGYDELAPMVEGGARDVVEI